MSYDIDDTIAAIATASGGSCRGMIRVSGPATLTIVQECFTAASGETLATIAQPTSIGGDISIPLDGARPRPIPCDLFFWPNERSYTRQTVAEFHTLGSPPVLHAALESICRSGARLAEPGEFTLRAFVAGRLDLTQAEAVLGVVDAEQADDLQTALSQLAGGLARPLHELRDELLGLLAELEAGLDFVEEDIEFIAADELVRRLQTIAATIRDIVAQMKSRSTSTSLPQVALIGAPNAGKSSLFNAIVAERGAQETTLPSRSPALVSNERGTTRDYLLATIDTNGTRFELIDTAGLEPDFDGTTVAEYGALGHIHDAAQSAGMERSRTAVLRAMCIDSTSDEADAYRTLFGTEAKSFPMPDIIILTKADRGTPQSLAVTRDFGDIPVVISSSVTGQGLDELCRVISRLLNRENARSLGCVAATADRCRDSLRLAEAAVTRAAEIAGGNGGEELVAAELRAALAELGKVVGAVYTDDLLDRIFKTFCIGK